MSVGVLRQSPGGSGLRSGRRRGSQMQRVGESHETLLGRLQLFLPGPGSIPQSAANIGPPISQTLCWLRGSPFFPAQKEFLEQWGNQKLKQL